MTARLRRADKACALLTTLAAISCTLPSFEKLAGERTGSDLSPSTATSGCPALDLPLGSACRSCVAENCCAEAGACTGGACGSEISLPITPLTEVSEEFDALAACMLQHCDAKDTCDTSWGCVSKYKWPLLRESHPFAMHVIDYAASTDAVGISGIKVKLCESSDPGCREGSGFQADSVTDASGNADFTAPKGFNGYFQLEGAMTAPATVQWSQPVFNHVDRFTHQALSAAAVTGFASLVGFHTRPDQAFEPNTGHLIARIQN